MNTVKIKAYAKVNLTLEITGEREGYHLLDSLVASVDISDVIVLKKRKDKLSSVTMRGLASERIPPEQNNALKAAELFSQKYGVAGADITVYKNIPLGAGLGGSSADASGVLRGMAKLYRIDDEAGIGELADRLGSDTKYMLNGGFVRMRGRGTELTETGICEPLHFLLILPRSSVSTGACYGAYDSMPKESYTAATENCIRALLEKDKEQAGRYLKNDLFLPAASLNTDVQKAYEEALSFSPLGAVMTGSGSCVLAFFETPELCAWAQSRYKGKFRTLVAKTVEPNKIKVWRNPFAL